MRAPSLSHQLNLRPRKDVSTTSCTRRPANLAATPWSRLGKLRFIPYQRRQCNANQDYNADNTMQTRIPMQSAIFLARTTSPDTARQPTWGRSRRQQKATSRQRFRCSSQSEGQGAMGYGKFVIPVVLWLKEHTLNVVFAFSLWLMSKFNRPKIIQNSENRDQYHKFSV